MKEVREDPRKTNTLTRAGAGESLCILLVRREAGSALVQESLESRSQDAKLTRLHVELEKNRPKNKAKPLSKIWHFCYN